MPDSIDEAKAILAGMQTQRFNQLYRFQQRAFIAFLLAAIFAAMWIMSIFARDWTGACAFAAFVISIVYAREYLHTWIRIKNADRQPAEDPDS